MSSATYAVYDDQSSHVRYSGPWIHYTLTGNEQIWNSTLTSAPAVGCSFSFDFNASILGVFGTILPANGSTRPVSSYSIDGASPSTFTPPDNITSRLDSQLFFVSDELASGAHVLTVTITVADGNDPYLIDYILVESPSSATSAAGAPTATYMTTSISGLPTATAQVAVESSSTGAPVGAIVGGVVGGVALLVVAALLVYFLWYRQKHVGSYFYHHLDHDLKPFIVAPYGAPSSSHDPSVRDSYLSSELSTADGANQTYSDQIPVLGAGTASHQPRTKAQIAGLYSAPPPTTYHTDAGIRFHAPGEPSLLTGHETDTPPVYTEH